MTQIFETLTYVIISENGAYFLFLLNNDSNLKFPAIKIK